MILLPAQFHQLQQAEFDQLRMNRKLSSTAQSLQSVDDGVTDVKIGNTVVGPKVLGAQLEYLLHPHSLMTRNKRRPEQGLSDVFKRLSKNSRTEQLMDPVVPSLTFAPALSAFQFIDFIVRPHADAERVLVD